MVMIKAGTNLGCDNYNQGNKECDMLLIEHLNNGNNMNGVDTSSSRVGKDGDKNMFFDIERSRIQGEFPASPLEEHPICDLGSH